MCESDPELRQLQSQLKSAYINQERAAQQEEKKLVSQELARREAALDAAMENDRQKLMELQNKEMARRNIAKESRGTLIAQMEENRKKAEEQGLKEYLKDKEQIDAIMRKVAEEDRKEQEEKKDAQHVKEIRG